jgi:hypothetical protein
MPYRLLAKKIVAFLLIASLVFNTLDSLRDIISVLPKIAYMGSPTTAQKLYLDLFKRAVIISSGLFIDGLYGFSLLIKPAAATKYIHIFFGVLIFLASTFLFRTLNLNLIIQNLPLFPLT